MLRTAFRSVIGLAVVLLCAQVGAAMAELRVVATVKPIHALVAGVMGDAGEPYLIVKGAASPHSFAMKPSDAAALQKAQIVFQIGGSFEYFLEAAIRGGATSGEIVTLSQASGVRKLPFRSGPSWTGTKAHDHSHANTSGNGFDPHIWLDPGNAIQMVGMIAQALGFAAPDRMFDFARNAAALAARLKDLEAEIKATVAPVRARPFLVFHDAFQYFETAFGVTASGAVSLGDSRMPGARRITTLRREVTARKVVCIFAEPQFAPRILATLVEGTKVRRGTLDPIGADIEPGADAYFTLMRRNARALADCLG